MDFIKKCNDDHVAAFGSMSAFFMLLSLFPFLIFFLTLTKIAPFSKEDIINVLVHIISFERESLIRAIVNEIYRKTGASVFTVSIIAALWSSSRGIYSIVIGLNAVYDIDENRNYVVLRIFSIFYTIVFAIHDRRHAADLGVWKCTLRLYLRAVPALRRWPGPLFTRGRFLPSSF